MYQHKFHIMPPQGWLNDPNGSCYYKGSYHIFFQYSKDDVNGGLKTWGHYTSKDLVTFKFEGEAVFPDSKWDKDGAYSGTAYTDDGKLELYYTGNVKHKGNYDYINEGRGHNCLRVVSDEGFDFKDKECLLENKDYPSNMSCHVRDPKIFKKDNKYYMLLGARTKDSKAAFLLYESDNKDSWNLTRSYIPKDDYGYMWECPDYFELNGHNIFSFCPQGLESMPDRFANIYQSGYIDLNKMDIINTADEELNQIIIKENLVEWDLGFDFYAPQTFKSNDNSTYLIGWAGVPDAGYGNTPSIKEGWQHSMTLIRKLEYKNGKIYQMPVKDIYKLRKDKLLVVDNNVQAELYWNLTADMFNGGCLYFNDDLELRHEDDKLILEFKNNTGEGRTKRIVPLSELKKIDIFMDGCIMEIYVNDGEYCLTTRYYPVSDLVSIKVEKGVNVNAWSMD